MKELERIESSANSKLKLVNKLHNHKYRKEENLFVADGIRLAEMAIQAQWPVKFALAATESLNNPRVIKAVEELQERKCPVRRSYQYRRFFVSYARHETTGETCADRATDCLP